MIKHTFGSGTGFMVTENLLVTNLHVTKQVSTTDIEVFFPSLDKTPRKPSRIVYEDAGRDLCILEMTDAHSPLS